MLKYIFTIAITLILCQPVLTTERPQPTNLNVNVQLVHAHADKKNKPQNVIIGENGELIFSKQQAFN